jgi:Phage tail protein
MLITFNGLNLTDESRYLITGIEGWDDLPDVVSGSAVRPRRHGSWRGGLLAPKRVVTIDLEILPDTANGNVNYGALLALRKAMALSDDERPLTIDLDYGEGAETISARVTALSLPTQSNYHRQRSASIEFTASDPRKYGAWNTKIFGTRTRNVVPVYPVKYPRKYTAYGNPGDLTVINTGGADSPPTFRIRGPIIKPGITINDPKGTRKITFDMTVGATQELVVNVYDGTARIGATNFYGDSRGALLEDMTIRPGTSTIHFSGTGNNSQNARLNVAYRSANL